MLGGITAGLIPADLGGGRTSSIFFIVYFPARMMSEQAANIGRWPLSATYAYGN